MATYKKLCTCGSPWVVNKKYGLCIQCNYKRLHGGKTKAQVIADRLAKAFLPATGTPVERPTTTMYRQKPIKQRSTKQERINRAIAAVYAKMDATQPMICLCCGDPRVTHSHILPRSQYKTFAANPRNIVYQCVTHHDIWEHGPLEAVEQLGNFNTILDRIEELAPYYFFRRFGVILEDYLNERKKTIIIL